MTYFDNKFVSRYSLHWLDHQIW